MGREEGNTMIENKKNTIFKITISLITIPVAYYFTNIIYKLYKDVIAGKYEGELIEVLLTNPKEFIFAIWLILTLIWTIYVVIHIFNHDE